VPDKLANGQPLSIMCGFNGTNHWDYTMDASTRAFTVIDYSHHEVHAGSHFIYLDAVTLNDTQTQVYLITTPNTTKWAHMLFAMDGSAITQFDLYEGADRLGTTAQTAGNSNRNSSTVATTTIHKDVSGGTTDGTLISRYKGGSSTKQSIGSTGTRSEEEIILKQNTKYLFRITSGSDGNLCNVRFVWYEHTDKTT